jgi:hypothetical protein
MKDRLTGSIPVGAAIVVVALVALASVVIGREQAPEVVAAAEPRAAPPAPSVEEIDLKWIVRERRERSIQDLFASPQPVAIIAPPPPPVPEQKPEPPPAPSAPPLPFTYLGQMKNGERLIVYLVKNQDMLLAEEGQTLGPYYRVEGVTDDAVHFLYLPLGTKQILAIPPRSPQSPQSQ